ncbi:MAG: antibiotic biosynthesis monooxygenase [bacterium]
MSIKIVIMRRYTDDQKRQIEPILTELYSLVFKYGGFVSGETLVNHEDPSEYLIIANWDSVAAWKAYHQAERVIELCALIDTIIGKKTLHRIFRNP